jgi:uncharacterized protein (DUF58 family)
MAHTSRSRAILLVALVPGVLGLVLGSAPLLLLSGGLVLAVARARDPPPEEGRLAAELEAPRVRRGETARVRLHAELEDGAALGLVHQGFPDTFALAEGPNLHLVDPGEPAEHTVEVAPGRRGRYELEPATLTAVHPLGLAPERELATADTGALTVEPVPVPLRAAPRLDGPGEQQPGPSRAPEGPASDEFEELRDYERGDPLKHVNWKATAKRSTRELDLIVNEYEPEARANVWFFLDLHESLEVGTTVDTALESAIEVALALVHQVTARGHRVGGATYDGDRDATFYPDAGSRQRLVVARELAEVGPGREREGLPAAVERCKGFLARERPATFVITRPETDTQRLAQGVRRIQRHTATQRRAAPVTVLAPEPPYEPGTDRLARAIAAREAEATLDDTLGGLTRVHRLPDGPRGLERLFAKGVLTR